AFVSKLWNSSHFIGCCCGCRLIFTPVFYATRRPLTDLDYHLLFLPMMTQESVFAASRSAAVAGRGTAYAATENVWTRELTMDGRVYYYDKATGASQWHIPTELYQSSTDFSKTQDHSQTQAGQGRHQIFPSSARSMLRVDCVTEAAPPGHAATMSHPTDESPESLIRQDPHVVLSNLGRLLPPAMEERLRSQAFEASCLGDFREVAGQSERMEVQDAASMVCALAAGMRSDPPLQLSERKCMDLALQFDIDDIGVITAETFLDLLCYCVTVRFVERSLGLEE
ncbi:unnamed protein product, partial [Polarella glacialis]